jgi:putative ABC transport system substrate-binding protein
MLTGWLAATGPCWPQQTVSHRIPLVGWLRVTAPDMPPGKPLRDALAAHGLIDGRDLRLELRLTEGHPERYPELARALVRDGAAIIIAFGFDAVRAAQAASATIPIVAVSNFLDEGLASSMGHPVGNVTGISLLVAELDPKKLEVLKELLPDLQQVGILNDAGTVVPERPRALAMAADKFGLRLTTVDVRTPADLEPAFQQFQREGVGAINILSSTMFAGLRPVLGELSRRYRMPVICQWREMVEAGCFASYGVTQTEMFALVADYVDRILKGTKPSELPIAQPTKFELVINMRVAREIGLTLAPSALQRADQVIE